MKVRVTIVILSVAGAITLIYPALAPTSSLTRYDFFLNLGTEILGIAVTIGMVEWLLERQRRRERAREITWNALHELDHAVWVWLGGSRSFNLAELWALLRSASPDDPVAAETGNLLFNIGAMAENTLRVDEDNVNSSTDLKRGLTMLTCLMELRDQQPPVVPSTVLREVLGALELLARAQGLRHPTAAKYADIMRDPSLQAQEYRLFGKNL